MIALLLSVAAFGVGVFLALYGAWTIGNVHGYQRGYRDGRRGL